MDYPANALAADSLIDSPSAWLRLCVAVVLGTVGTVGMWSVPVALPAVQAEFSAARADASLPFTLSMFGFAIGGVLMGRLADRFGILIPIVTGAVALGLGYVIAGHAGLLASFALAYALIGFGSSATFAPLIADTSHWFARRRGIAVAITASGNYLGGALWPPVLQYGIASSGWRATHILVGLFCVVFMAPLALIVLRQRAPGDTAAAASAGSARGALGLSSNALLGLLCLASVSCCVAMAMPQVHIVAYCGDLGYGVARGAEMLSIMLGFGVVSRIASGFIADRIGGVRTLLFGSALQGVALFLYLLFDSLASLYVISALFGLFQGGIVAMYAVIVREYFPPREAGTYVGIVIMGSLFGMALGGWLSGLMFDVTGSYRAAFANGLAWNLINVSIALFLLIRTARPAKSAPTLPERSSSHLA